MLGPVMRQRGFTLVEMMIGLAIGLFIVGSATGLLTARLREHKAMLVEARLMQDLRTSVDIVTRDLRRSGYWGQATVAMRAASPASNPYLALAPAGAASDAVSFQMSRDEVENNRLDDNEQFGFRLRRGALDMLIGSGGWQALTDAGTMNVTAFTVTPSVREQSLAELCDKPCPAGTPTCGPMLQQRSLAISITARASADSRVVRTLTSAVTLRNDAIAGACPA
jgi:prepilin peptidase dependent protein B